MPAPPHSTTRFPHQKIFSLCFSHLEYHTMGTWDVTQGLGDAPTPDSDEINPTFPTQGFQWECNRQTGQKGGVFI